MEEKKQPITPITVWHVDNERKWQERVAEDLRDAGYLVITTGSATEAMGMIPGAIYGVKAAVLDNDLGDGQGGTIAESIKKSGLPVAIIGLAGGFGLVEVPWADAALDKQGYDNLSKNNELLKALNKLLQTE